MISLAVDENLDHHILRALCRRQMPHGYAFPA